MKSSTIQSCTHALVSNANVSPWQPLRLSIVALGCSLIVQASAADNGIGGVRLAAGTPQTALSANGKADWALYGGNALHQRYSPLAQITPENVQTLEVAWEVNTGVTGPYQATPIVVDGVMYVSLPYNHVVALDAASGREIWRYRHTLKPDRKLCCGPANRGVAVSNGRVFMGTVDGRLIALSQTSGEKVWDTDVIGDAFGIGENVEDLGAGARAAEKRIVTGSSGAGLNMAPMVWKGKVIIGVTGVGYGLHLDSPEPEAPLGAVIGMAGRYGERGFMAAFDVQTGKRAWKFDTVPSRGWEGSFVQQTPDGLKLPRNIEAEKAALPKYRDAWKFGGGSAWSTPAIDPETGTLFFGTGNPSPQMEGSSRPGDNLYTTSLVALDANTGTYRWHYQQVPHDMWGYDVASPPVLFDTVVNGKTVKAVGQAGKTGWFYVHDRRTGQLIRKSESFVPRNNDFALPTPEGTVVWPGVVGGSNWSPSAYDPVRRTSFVAGLHWPVKYTLHALPARDGRPALNYSSMEPLEGVERYGLLSAIDVETGKITWQQRTPNPLIGGVLSTASGLVFTGEGNGELLAVHADSGRRLWAGQAPAGVNAPPITYAVGGQQYIAVAAGGNKLFGYKLGQTIKAWKLRSDPVPTAAKTVDFAGASPSRPVTVSGGAGSSVGSAEEEAMMAGDPLRSQMWGYMRKESFPADADVAFDERIVVQVPKFADDAMNVPVTVDASALGEVRKIVVLVDRNPIRKVLEFMPDKVKPALSFRFKLEQASPIRAAALLPDGRWRVGYAFIDASGGGCTVPGATRKDGSWSKTLNQVSSRVFEGLDNQKGSLRLRLRVQHPMDTGLVAGIPAFYIQQLKLKDANGVELARLFPFEPVSENPLFSFDFATPPAAPLSIEGRDNNGNTIRAKGL